MAQTSAAAEPSASYGSNDDDEYNSKSTPLIVEVKRSSLVSGAESSSNDGEQSPCSLDSDSDAHISLVDSTEKLASKIEKIGARRERYLYDRRYSQSTHSKDSFLDRTMEDAKMYSQPSDTIV